jgi:hypothetical protein
MASPLFATLHQLVDAARFHSEQQVIDAHDSITAHVEGFKSLDDYRKAQAAKAPADTAAQDAILAQAVEIHKQREAQATARAEQQAQIAALAQAQRPSTPVAVVTEPLATPVAVVTEPPATLATPVAVVETPATTDL